MVMAVVVGGVGGVGGDVGQMRGVLPGTGGDTVHEFHWR